MPATPTTTTITTTATTKTTTTATTTPDFLKPDTEEKHGESHEIFSKNHIIIRN